MESAGRRGDEAGRSALRQRSSTRVELDLLITVIMCGFDV